MTEKNFIYGKNSIIEALESGEREFNKILISSTARNDEKIEKIKKLAQTNGIVFQFVNKEKLNQIAPECNHQGILALIAPINYLPLDNFLETDSGKKQTVVILDGIEDSHNLGAIIRSCVCAGVDAIILPSRRGVLINATVEKTSAGAVNHIKIIKVNSIVNAVQKLKEHDYWVIASEHHSNDNYYDVDYTDINIALIMGAEHAGISKSLLKLSDYKVAIPMLTNFNSLNVSNATAIILFEIVKQKLQQNFKKRG
ncbi:MAG: 23S rRNA (guanosine(2251)-2'-O)-methyltransferase RlmB [bacterium]|nr:23S rRNA (guanosine(2251)-2'-O)-methyltransferase RlmB [bacterium]